MNRVFVSLLFVAAVGCETRDIRVQREEFERRAVRITNLERELTECRANLTLAEHGSAQSAVAPAAALSFTTWKTIKLGTDQPTDPAQELERLGFKVSDWAKQLLAKTVFATEPMAVDLVRVTVAELGFPEGATTQDIFNRATALGLTRLPAETGYRLRLALTDQSQGEWIRIGMEPIAGSGGSLDVFSVDRGDDGRWLDADCASPARQWFAGCVWVFGRSKP